VIFRLLRKGVPLLVYFCLATLIAQAAVFAYLGVAFGVDRDKAMQIFAVLQDVDLFEMRREAEREREQVSPEQVSYEQIMEARARNVFHLQLREDALKNGLQQLDYEQRRLSSQKKEFELVRAAFQKQLFDMQEGAIAAGMENLRLKLESIKAPEAKNQIAEMLGDGRLDQVVVLLANMPSTKSAKIMSEFKTDAEIEQLYEILQRIGEGYPEYDLAADMLSKLPDANPPPP